MSIDTFRDLESMTIGLDDTFKFHCDQCGKCCTHREDIILSPMDIFKMAILKLTAHTETFITEFFAESVKVLQMLQARKELLENGIILLICPNRRSPNKYPLLLR